MRKLIVLIVALTLLSSFMIGCSNTPAQDTDINEAESRSNTANDEAWPRTIVDAAGNETVLEKQPKRITLLHIVYMEHLLALDTPPTAAAIGNALGEMGELDKSELYAPYLKNIDMEVIGSSTDLNLEAVLESEPDLLVTFHNPAGLQAYDQLVEIAPVVQLDYNSTWQEQLLMVGRLLGKEQLAEKRIEETEKKIADAKEKLEQHKDKTLALFRTDGKNFIAQGSSKYYEVFGISKPATFPDTAKPGDTTSLEGVAEMNPYYIVFQHNYDLAKAFVESMESSSVWQSMDAVKNGRIYYFDENMNSYGPLTLNLAADKLVEIYSE